MALRDLERLERVLGEALIVETAKPLPDMKEVVRALLREMKDLPEDFTWSERDRVSWKDTLDWIGESD